MSGYGISTDTNGNLLLVVYDQATEKTLRLAAGTHTDADYAATVARLRASYTALRQWKVDADAAVAAWDGRTVAQNMAVLKVVVQRFGNLADGMADLLQTMNADA